jgi:hypothetical protein
MQNWLKNVILKISIYYINYKSILKEYSYLFLYNSDRYNDGYEFKSLGLCSGCKI